MDGTLDWRGWAVTRSLRASEKLIGQTSLTAALDPWQIGLCHMVLTKGSI